MSLVHADNFSIYGTSTGLLLNGIYAETERISLTTDPDGVSSGHVLSVNTGGPSNFCGVRYVLPASNTRVGVAMRVWLPALPTGRNGVVLPIQWRGSSNSAIATLTVETTGVLSLRAGTYNGAIIADSGVPVITANGWYHLEAILDVSAETFELRVEGKTVINTSSLPGVADVPAQLWFGGRSTNTSFGRSYQIKDLVVYNGDGSYNNDFLGSVLVANLTVTSDVALNWTPSTGSDGYTILDNVPPVDSQYIYAEDSPLPSPYVGTLSELPPETTSVKGIITFVRAAKSDGGDGSLQVGLISDPDGTPVTVDGANRPITVAQTYWRDVFEEDPSTTAPWTPNAVNQVQLQIDRTT